MVDLSSYDNGYVGFPDVFAVPSSEPASHLLAIQYANADKTCKINVNVNGDILGPYNLPVTSK